MNTNGDVIHSENHSDVLPKSVSNLKKIFYELLQQEQRVWRPLFRPGEVVVCAGVFGLFFLIFGIIILTTSISLFSGEVDYTHIEVGSTGIVSFEFTEDVDSPIYIYIELNKFYQNNRRLLESQSALQMRDNSTVVAIDSIDSCDPFETNDDGINLYPCGIYPKTTFNDSILPFIDGIGWIEMDDSPETITWGFDNKHLFKQADPYVINSETSTENYKSVDMWILNYYPPSKCIPKIGSTSSLNTYGIPIYIQPQKITSYKGSTIIVPKCTDLTDIGTSTCSFSTKENDIDGTNVFSCVGNYQVIPNTGGLGINNGNFINWMRPGSTSTIRKFYGKINKSFKNGDILNLYVQSNFLTSSYGGYKKIILAQTSSWLGGSNLVLGIVMTVIGSAFILTGGFFLVVHFDLVRKNLLDYKKYI